MTAVVRQGVCKWCGASILWLTGIRRPVDAESVLFKGQADGLVYSYRHHGFRYADDVYPDPERCNMTHYCAPGAAAAYAARTSVRREALAIGAEAWQALLDLAAEKRYGVRDSR